MTEGSSSLGANIGFVFSARPEQKEPAAPSASPLDSCQHVISPNESAMPAWMMDAFVSTLCLFCVEGVTEILLSLCVCSQCLGHVPVHMMLGTPGMQDVPSWPPEQPLHSCVFCARRRKQSTNTGFLFKLLAPSPPFSSQVRGGKMFNYFHLITSSVFRLLLVSGDVTAW